MIARGQEVYVALTNLKNGYTFEPILYTGYLANLYAALHRDALIAGFRAAGIHVEERHLSSFRGTKEGIIIHYGKTPEKTRASFV